MAATRSTHLWPRWREWGRRRGAMATAIAATVLAGCAGDGAVPLQLAGPHAPTTEPARQVMAMVPADGAAAVAADLVRPDDVQLAAQWPLTEIDWQCLVLSVPTAGDRDDLLERLGRDRRLALVQPMQTFELAAGAGGDPLSHLQGGFHRIAADAAHVAATGKGVRVAIIDSGVAATHADLVDQVVAWRDMTGDPTAPVAGPEAERVTALTGPRLGIAGLADDGTATRAGDPHGTAVAGVIAAGRGNGIGISGVAPEVDVIALQACWETDDGGEGRCSSFTLARALNVALAAESDIINFSVQGPADPTLTRLLDEAERRAVVVVGADRRSDVATFPATHPAVVAVRAAEDASAAGADGEVVRAPGRDIFTTAPANSYATRSGASMAAAHVTGVVALLHEVDPRLGPADVRSLLIPEGGGRGVVNACASVDRVVRRRGGAALHCPAGVE